MTAAPAHHRKRVHSAAAHRAPRTAPGQALLVHVLVARRFAGRLIATW